MTAEPGVASEGGFLAVHWVPRAEPLEPSAALGRGETATRLAVRLLAMDDAELAKFEAVASPRLVLVLGPNDALPWVEGIEYFGRDPAAPSLLVPTALAPSVPPAWLARAFAKKLASSRLPGLALIAPNPPLIVPLGARLGLARSALERWLGERGHAPEPDERRGTS